SRRYSKPPPGRSCQSLACLLESLGTTNDVSDSSETNFDTLKGRSRVFGASLYLLKIKGTTVGFSRWDPFIPKTLNMLGTSRLPKRVLFSPKIRARGFVGGAYSKPPFTATNRVALMLRVMRDGHRP